MKNTMESICTWFEKAKPNPTEKDLAVQVGCHFEEVAEMLEATGDSQSTSVTLEDLAGLYKSGWRPTTIWCRWILKLLHPRNPMIGYTPLKGNVGKALMCSAASWRVFP